ncbi:MAG: hypothetical protein A2Y33_03440 [Spirochaetes bacterium GWF1_51_8]|nr:MAG: hypothetical protein A2Y33_03440 [Spirochaetes bacterium GWF1_51_8]
MKTKILVVYYSHDGNTRMIAETVANELGADIDEIAPVHDINSRGFFKYFLGGAMAAMKMKPKLGPAAHDPSGYDRVILGTPVWNSTMAPPMRAYLVQNRLKIKMAGLFCCFAGAVKNTFAEMKTMLDGCIVTGEAGFLEPLVRNEAESSAAAREWARGLLKRIYGEQEEAEE